MSQKPWEYGVLRRPPGLATVPQRGWIGTRPSPVFQHGVVQYDRYLSRDELEAFELLPLDLGYPTNLRAGVEAFERRVLDAFTSREPNVYAMPDRHTGGQLVLTHSTRPGVDFQVTSFDARMTPTGHRDYVDFGEAVRELWSNLSLDERDAITRTALGLDGEPGAVRRFTLRKNPIGAPWGGVLGLGAGAALLAWGIARARRGA